MAELQEIINDIMSLPLHEKTCLAEILLRDIDARKAESTEIPEKRTFGEYIGKIEMSDDFNAKKIINGESHESPKIDYAVRRPHPIDRKALPATAEGPFDVYRGGIMVFHFQKHA